MAAGQKRRWAAVKVAKRVANKPKKTSKTSVGVRVLELDKADLKVLPSATLLLASGGRLL
jgi:hypothetical protein